MQNRNLRLLFAAIGATICVAVIVTLVLTSSLWPERGKDSGKKTMAGGVANLNSENGNRDLATASKPATGQNISANTANSTVAKKAEPSGALAPPPIREEISKGYYRDPKTGEMKEMPVTVQVMLVRDADGKPSMVSPDGKMNMSNGEQAAGLAPKKIDATKSSAKSSGN
ncbi:MAG: hypothetical protein ACKVS6_11030 [Planctomycetota bacterium]